MSVAHRSPGRYLDPMEMSADYSSGAKSATGRDVRPLTVLGLETSCDETAASVVRLTGGRAEVLSSIVHSQIDDHAAYGGVVPEIAARSHVEMIAEVTRRAMAEVDMGYDGLDGVAATAGPGLVGGVMVGLSFGKAAALARGLPLVAVNHLEGHAVSARLGAEVAYPFLLLLVSGGHCQLLEVRGVGDMSRIGATIDDAAGEAFDKIAKALGLGYPGGPALERLAVQGDGSKIDLPRALLGRKDCDFSFSGLKTAAFRIAQTCGTEQDKADLAVSEFVDWFTERTAQYGGTACADILGECFDQKPDLSRCAQLIGEAWGQILTTLTGLGADPSEARQ